MMKNICSYLGLILLALLCFHVFTASQSTRNHRSKRLSSTYCSIDAQCKNGGTCIFGNTCQCAYGYKGPYCETRFECNKRFLCQKNGECELDLQANKTFCRCNQNPSFSNGGRYEGAFCERKMPCHATGYCLADGQCRRDSVVTDMFYCECADGFTGSNCQESTCCLVSDVCLHGGVCSQSTCSCILGYTGHFCELEVTPALNYSAQRFWAFNQQIRDAKGAAKVIRSPQLGNVISLLSRGGGWIDLGHLHNSCFDDFNTCQQGMSFAFWLQFIDGAYVMSLTKANSTVLSVQVTNSSNLLIQLHTGSNLWQIKRDCFPMGWLHLSVIWNNTTISYFENGKLLSQTQAPVPMNTSLPQSVSLLSVGSYMGQGGFSTMSMSDLAFWTRALPEQEVKQVYLKKLSSAFTSRCLSNPCPAKQWCENDNSKSSNFSCIKPAGFYCSFNSGYCQWQNASINDQHWMEFSRYGSLRHDHTGNTCASSGKFLGLASQSKLSSDVISRIFPRPSDPGKNVSLSMWYYMEEWTTKTLSIVLWSSTGNKTLFSVNEKQSRQWKYLKIEFPVNGTFQVILRGELFGSGGIFVDDISVETFNKPVILTKNTSYSTILHSSISMVCMTDVSFNITWYRDNQPIKHGRYYVIYKSSRAGRKGSLLNVKNANCQRAGNYTCVATNEYGSDKLQFTLTILDIPRPPSNIKLDPITKQITWKEASGYDCLPKSHFVVEYTKRWPLVWKTAGYYDNRKFDLINATKGQEYVVQIYATNSVGTSRKRSITFWTNIEPTGTQLFVTINGTSVPNVKTILVKRGVKVNVRCQVTAEPTPRMIWHVPYNLENVTFYGKYRVSGITWQMSLDITSMSCRNTGTYWCKPQNLLGSQKSTAYVSFKVSEPDPPKTFSVVFVNITSVIVSWSAYTCNGIVNPSIVWIRYRKEGNSSWIEKRFNDTKKEIVVTDEFHYGTAYEFGSRLVYGTRVGVYSHPLKIRSPELKEFFYAVTVTILNKAYRHTNDTKKEIVVTDEFHYGTAYEFGSRLVYGTRVGVYSHPLKIRSPELKEFFYAVTVTILNKAYREELRDRQSTEFVKLSKQISQLFLKAISHLPEPKEINLISFEGSDTTVARFQLSIPYFDTSQLQEGLLTFIRARNKQNRSLLIDDHSFTVVQVPGLANVTMTTDFTGQAGTMMTIYCSAVGPAALAFSWKRDHVTLKPSFWVKITQYNITWSVLTIRMTRKTDSGNYTCNASKSRTSRQETVYVHVSEPPIVNIRPLVRTLFEGESVTFHCDLSRGNTSRLNVVWYKMAKNSQEKLISCNNDSLRLTVQGHARDSAQSHVTHYRCTVRNTDGVGSSPSAKLVVLSKGDTVFCASELFYGIMWSMTSPGTSDIQRCPNASGRAVRPCLMTHSEAAKWGQVNLSDCMSRQIKQIHNEVVAFTEGYAVNKTLRALLENLENVTATYSARSAQMYERDLRTSVDTLTKLIKYNAANTTKPLSNRHDISNMIKTSSNLLRLTNLPAWKSALEIQDDIAYQMVSALDECGHHSTNKTNDIHIDTENVVLVAVKVSANSSASTKGLQLTNGQSSLDLPPTFFSQTNRSVTVVSVFFKTLDKVLSSTEELAAASFVNDSDWFVNSILASITIRPRPPDVITPPFRLALETQKVTPTRNKRACVFLNITTSHRARAHNNTWSTDGCRVVPSRTNNTTTTCACDHMTLFAVLMDSGGDKITDAKHRIALSWISIVGCLLSLLGITVTLVVTFCFWKNLRSPRTIVLVNLCVAIAVTDVLIVAMEIADLPSQTSCTVLAVFLHFFVLSIFCWMLSEGVQLYFSLVKVIGAAAEVNVKFFCCLGWGIPAFVVSVSLAATQGRGYADMQTCWLNTQNHVLWAFVAPALLIVSGNMVVFSLVIYSMLSSHRFRKESLARRFQRGFKASFVLLPLLGISWSFGVLTMTSDKIVFNYIFAIFNSLQGFLIFVFHCILNKQIRDVMSENKRKRAGILVTDAMTGHSNRKLSTTTDTAQGTSGRHSSATGFRLLNLQLLKSEICPSPHPSPVLSRACKETSPLSVEASPVTRPRAERAKLIQNTVTETREEKQEKETTDDANDDDSRTQVSMCSTIPASLNACDMDEKDMTSSETSLESIEYRGLKTPVEKQKSSKMSRRCTTMFKS